MMTATIIATTTVAAWGIGAYLEDIGEPPFHWSDQFVSRWPFAFMGLVIGVVCHFAQFG